MTAYDDGTVYHHSPQTRAQLKAGRAMLAALKNLVPECDQDMDEAYNPHAAPLARARAAIAQAEAAGIEEGPW